MTDTGLDEVSLGVPAHIVYGRVIRLAAASLAVNQGMGFGEIDDLRSVVDGMISVLLNVDGGSDDDTIEVTYRVSDGRIEIEAERTGSATLREAVLDEFVDVSAALIDGIECRGSSPWLRLKKTVAGDT